ncbi:P4Hc domain-containing protein [Pseudohyphozyma bogoriensis]|nr:P4Hc domain-containing protein [Pseudohyphozyma bogoriensis]
MFNIIKRVTGSTTSEESTPSSTSWEPRFAPTGKIDFKAAGLPQYQSCYAIILDNLFTRAELVRFLSTAESSVNGEWDVARVNATSEISFVDTDYRRGDRIILDSEELSEEIFARIREGLREVEEIEREEWSREGRRVVKKRMVRMNERLRFLRYPPGGFFRKHIDGPYITPDNSLRTYFTVQLYLPSDASGSEESFKSVEGGSTRFLVKNNGYVDVEPIPGRVLVFQHERLLHTGEEVISGTKCAVRCDILYENVEEETPAPVTE